MPPSVFSRWMNVVSVSLPGPFGPASVPAAGRRSHAIALWSGVTDFAGGIELLPHTLLVSRECCHVGRSRPPSSGLGLLKCVMICWPFASLGSNSVACGPTNAQAKPDAGHFPLAAVVIALGHAMQM